MAGLTYFINPVVNRSSLNAVNIITSRTKSKFRSLEVSGKRSYATVKNKTMELIKRQKQYNSEIDETSGVFRNLAGAVTAYFGARTILSGLDLASDVSESNNKLDSVYGNMVTNVRSTMDRMNNALNLGKVRLKKDFSDIGAIFKGLGFGGDGLVKNTKNLLKGAYDAASFHNLSFSQSINAIRGAMLGESEALKSATGIIVQENTMQEYADQAGLVWKNLNNAQKAQLRLNYTLEKLKEQGAANDLEKTKDGYANVSRAINDLKEDAMAGFFTSLKDSLLPTLIQTRDYLKENQDEIASYGQALGNTINFIREHKTAIGVLIGVYGTYQAVNKTALAITKASDMWKATKSIPLRFKENLLLIKNTALLGYYKTQALVMAGAQKLLTAGQWALNVALNANPIGLVVGGIALLGGAFVLAYKKIEPFRNFINDLWDKLRNSSFGKLVGKLFGGGKSEIELTDKTGKNDRQNSNRRTVNHNYRSYYNRSTTNNSVVKNTPKPSGSSISDSTVNNITRNSRGGDVNVSVGVNNGVDSEGLKKTIEKKVNEGVTEYNRQQLAKIGGGI